MIDRGSLSVVLARATDTALTKAAIRVQNEARRNCPVDTGTLRRSITFSLVGSTPQTRTARVGSNVEYALMVENGTRPHVIRPKRTRALKFQIGGRTIYAKRVNHPGTRATNFLKDALRAAGRG